MRAWEQKIATLLIAIVLALGLVSAGCLKQSPQAERRVAIATPTVKTPRSLSPLPVRPLSPELARMFERAKRAASATRELPWLGAARMTELTGWEYGTRSREMAEALGGDELRALSRLAVAGGMLPAGTDLAMLAASFTAASAGASYSPLDKGVLLLQAEPKEREYGLESLVTHELVHALQDQHFDLLRLLLVRPYNFDRTEALFSVIEGDAMNVQRRLEAGENWTSRSLEDMARSEDERFGDYRREIGAVFPPLLTETFIFRYRDGARFVEAVRRKGGARAVNELFQHPPASSEQILHPEKYLAGEMPRSVAVNVEGFAAQGWPEVVAATPLGEIGIRGLLLKSLSQKEAARAAAGWDGDDAYLFEGTKRASVFVWQTIWDSSGDALEFFRAYSASRPRGSELIEDKTDTAQRSWRESGQVTVVRLSGEKVVIVRGAEADVPAAFQLALSQ